MRKRNKKSPPQWERICKTISIILAIIWALLQILDKIPDVIIKYINLFN